VITCPACGEQNPEPARFCVACGSALPRQGAVPVGAEERKLVTVFAGLVSGAEQVADPEQLRSLLHAYQGPMSRFVTGHGGTVDKVMGRAALCVFGAPTAHEDDPERGVRATLRLRDAVTEPAPPQGDLELSLRAGAAGYARLAPGWVDDGFGLEEARVRLGLGRCPVAPGRRTEARGAPEKAEALAEQLGAEPVTSEVDALLEGAPA
jgi:hypothetical protein